jgi:hypothetical protein
MNTGGAWGRTCRRPLLPGSSSTWKAVDGVGRGRVGSRKAHGRQAGQLAVRRKAQYPDLGCIQVPLGGAALNQVQRSLHIP